MELDDAEAQKVGLKLTIAKYYTPSGRSIQEKGISPDIIIEEGTVTTNGASRVRREKDLDHHLKNEGGQAATGSAGSTSKLARKLLTDLQVKTALDHLKAYKILRAAIGSPPPAP